MLSVLFLPGAHTIGTECRAVCGVVEVVVVSHTPVGYTRDGRGHEPFLVFEVNVGGDVVAHVCVGDDILTH